MKHLFPCKDDKGSSNARHSWCAQYMDEQSEKVHPVGFARRRTLQNMKRQSLYFGPP
jgi:hypothetical protein